MKKALIITALILSILFVADLAMTAMCWNCPQCGSMGVQIQKTKADYSWICTYRCVYGHIWQCECW